MPKIKNRLKQPLVINVEGRSIHIRPHSSADITDRERNSPHIRRLESAGHLAVIQKPEEPDEDIPEADTGNEKKTDGKKRKIEKKKKKKK